MTISRAPDDAFGSRVWKDLQYGGDVDEELMWAGGTYVEQASKSRRIMHWTEILCPGIRHPQFHRHRLEF